MTGIDQCRELADDLTGADFNRPDFGDTCLRWWTSRGFKIDHDKGDFAQGSTDVIQTRLDSRPVCHGCTVRSACDIA